MLLIKYPIDLNIKLNQEFIPTTACELTSGDALRLNGQFWQFVGRVIINEVEMARIANGPYLRLEVDIELSTPVEKVLYVNNQ